MPKTLVFAKTDLHAEDIVRIIREEFGKGNDFCQKITSKTTGKKPEDLLARVPQQLQPAHRRHRGHDRHRHRREAAGMPALHAEHPLAVLLRADEGPRLPGHRPATTCKASRPTPRHKTHFVIVDAVGVCEDDKTTTKPLDRKPSVPLDKLLQSAARASPTPTSSPRWPPGWPGSISGSTAEQQDHITTAAGGKSLAELSAELLSSIDADTSAAAARRKFNLADEPKPTDQQLDAVERNRMAAALKPFHNPQLRDAIIAAKTSLEQIVDEVTQDRLLASSFDAAALDKAQTVLTNFRQFIDDNKDEIEAIQILYHARTAPACATGTSRNWPPRLSARRSRSASRKNACGGVRSGRTGQSKRPRRQSTRRPGRPRPPRARSPTRRSCPSPPPSRSAIKNGSPTNPQPAYTFTAEQRRWLDAIKDHIADSLAIEQDDLEDVPFNQMGGLGRAHELFGDRLTALLEELNGRLAA